MIMRAAIAAVTMLCLGLTVAKAQQSVTAAGKDASTTEGSISWSVGQVAFINAAGTSGSISQGVQQPNLFFHLGLPKPKPKPLTTLSVFPNPTTGSFMLQIP